MENNSNLHEVLKNKGDYLFFQGSELFLMENNIAKAVKFISLNTNESWENVKFDDSALSLIALNSRGSFRDAESLLDQCMSFAGENSLIKTQDIKELLGIVEVGQIAQFVDFLLLKNTKDAVLSLNSMADNGVDLQEFAKTLVFYLRQALLLKINPNFLNLQNSGLSSGELEKMKSQTMNLTQKDIQNMLELFIDAENRIKYSAVIQLPLELAIINITYQES
jgi:DNA polymerase-3 subunit gamma/tau